MKIQILLFSPSGNTNAVGELIKNQLISRGQEVSLINITGNKKIFSDGKIREFLESHVMPHDVLVIGAPVYAHHLQYHMIELINNLPKPDAKWGAYAIPFVTYGGISSGIALKEATKHLNKSGRSVHAGLKVACSHRMTRAFMEKEFNIEKNISESIPQVIELVNRIMQLSLGGEIKTKRKAFDYNGLATNIKAKLIFREKLWHKKRYAKIAIDNKMCSNCGECVKLCPVKRLVFDKKTINQDSNCGCIHCFNCVSNCPNKAINLIGDLRRGKLFMAKMIKKIGNKEKPHTAVYPLFDKNILSKDSNLLKNFYLKMFKALESDKRYEKYPPLSILKSIDFGKSSNILEIGCGSGFFTLEASKLINKTANYLAIDINKYAVEETINKLERDNITNVKVEVKNALNTNLPDRAFDLIILFGIIPSPFIPLNDLCIEINRITQKNGILAVWSINNFNLIKHITRKSGFKYIGNENNVLKFQKTSNAI